MIGGDEDAPDANSRQAQDEAHIAALQAELGELKAVMKDLKGSQVKVSA